MKKTIIIMAIIAIATIMIIVIANKVMNNLREEPTSAQKEMQIIEKNIVEQINEGALNGIITDVTSGANNTSNNNVTETTKEKTDLEKAIDIVKKDWGTDSSVYFAQDGKTKDGKYIICVRDKNSTAALKWYQVNVKDGTFTKE